jgi:hypothetical protein
MSSPMMCVDFWRLEQQTQPYLKQKLGFISAQLHRGISGSCMFVNYAVEESVEYFNQATSDPAFRSALARYPESTAAREPLIIRTDIAI